MIEFTGIVRADGGKAYRKGKDGVTVIASNGSRQVVVCLSRTGCEVKIEDRQGRLIRTLYSAPIELCGPGEAETP